MVSVEKLSPKDDINDTTKLLKENQGLLDSDDTSDSFEITSAVDEVVDNLKIGLFHYILLIACGLCYSSHPIFYQSLGIIIITACDLNINATNKGWLSINYMIGLIVGSGLFGRLADAYGRRRILLISILISLISILASALAINYLMLVIMTGLNGCAMAGICATVHSYALEFFPRHYRGKAGVCVSSFMILGNIFSWGVALLIFPRPFHAHLGRFYITNWRLYLLVITIPNILSFVILIFLPDSLRWMICKQNKIKIMMVLHKINRINSCYRSQYVSHEDTSIQLMPLIDTACLITHSKNDHKSTGTFIVYFRKLMLSPWRGRLILLSIAWFGYSLGDQGFTIWLPTIISYYVSGKKCFQTYHNLSIHPLHSSSNLSFNVVYRIHSSNYSGCYSDEKIKNVILNLLLGNLLSIPVTILCLLLINRIGRKILYCFMTSVCGLSIFMIWLLDQALSTMILSSIFLSFTTNAWIPCKIWSSELFCTEIRSTAIGILIVMGNFGAILGMIVFVLLFHVNCTATLLLFSLLGLLSVSVTLFLPDTTAIDIG